jgi:hypothetical protein
MIATLPESAFPETRTPAVLEVRTRAALAETMLTQVGALEPEERDALVRIMDDTINGLEELLSRLLKTFESGVSLSDAAILGQLLTKSANLHSSSVELVASRNPELREWRQVSLDRLRRVRQYAESMLRLANLPPPALDPERMRRSQEQMERGEGYSSEEILAKLRDE